MDEAKLKDFLEEKKGYAKKGTSRFLEILKEKGISLVGITRDQVKEILKQARANNTTIIKPKKRKAKILVYDIETSLVEAQLWGSGQQWVGHNDITTETQIITVAWKWIGSDEVHKLHWSMKKKNDEKLITTFMDEYNSADLVVGWNNNSFDNKIVNSRAMKYGLDVNTHVKSFDIMRQVKKVFRLPSYSMAYVSKYLGLQGKLGYDGGIRMWKEIQWGDKITAANAMQTMMAYNVQDVVLTEEIYFKLRKYLGNVINVNALDTNLLPTVSAWACPNCGSKKVQLYKTTATPAGTIQRVMQCKKDKVKYKITNSNYLKFLEDQNDKTGNSI